MKYAKYQEKRKMKTWTQVFLQAFGMHISNVSSYLKTECHSLNNLSHNTTFV